MVQIGINLKAECEPAMKPQNHWIRMSQDTNSILQV